MGSVLVTLKQREDLRDIADLKNKTIAAGLPDSVPGWLAVLGEVRKAGFDPDEFFASSEFLFEYYPEIIAALWGGKADAVALPTCMLESLEREGLVATDQLKVLHDKSDDALACKRSTDLYPDLSLVGFSWTPEKMARDVTVALMSQQSDVGFEWLSYVSHANVDQLLKDLKAGPYSYLRDFSLKALYARHTAVFWAIGAVFCPWCFTAFCCRFWCAAVLGNFPKRSSTSAAWKKRLGNTGDDWDIWKDAIRQSDVRNDCSRNQFSCGRHLQLQGHFGSAFD